MAADSSGTEPADVQRISARNATLLDCRVGRECKGRRRRIVIITFGGTDGAVDSVALTPDEGYRLMRGLLNEFKVNGAFSDPLTFQKRFCIPHSIGRAKIDLRLGTQKMFEKLVKEIPEIAEYIRAEVAALAQMLQRRSNSPRRAARIVERVREALLVAVDAARIDT